MSPPEPPPPRSLPNFRLFWWSSGFAILGVGLLVLLHGYPLDRRTWIGLLIGLPLALPAMAVSRRKSLAALPLLYYLALLFSPEAYNLMDVRGGRHGRVLQPWELRFGRDGRNTRLLESRLGPLEPQWCHSSVAWDHFAKSRDGNERVHTRNLIFHRSLPATLEMLPTDEARTQVLACLADTENLLRVHQGLLLTCLREWGYPAGHDSASWWARHRHLFRHEYDPRAAALTVAGWQEWLWRHRDMANDVGGQAMAAHYYQWGSWGAQWGKHPQFAEEYERLREQAAADGKRDPDQGLKEVVWWPEKQSDEPPG